MTMPERWKSLTTPLNLHLGGTLLLLALNIYLVVQIAIAIGIAHASNSDAMVEQKIKLGAATVAVQPLRGLDGKLAQAKSDAAGFEKSRLAAEQSAVLSELGDLAHKSGVKISRVQYSPVPTVQANLTEEGMDASLTGDYPLLVKFINSLERDKNFFVINSVTLSGQSGGVVTLKIRFTTWLRTNGTGAAPASGTSPEKTTTTPDKTTAATLNEKEGQ
jgi:hypothetical protein